MILLINEYYALKCTIAWLIILIGTILILKVAPVENVNRELDQYERKHCKGVTKKVLTGIIVVSAVCTYLERYNTVSLIALTIMMVIISQYMGIVMFKLGKTGGDSRKIYYFRLFYHLKIKRRYFKKRVRGYLT